MLEEREFTAMLKGKTVNAALQPIVNVSDGRLRAFEVLGRGYLVGLPQSPMEMFAMAGRLAGTVRCGYFRTRRNAVRQRAPKRDVYRAVLSFD